MPAVRQSCVVVRERWHPVSVQLVVVCSTPGEGYFGDESPPEGSPVFEWHLNFAHSDLFEVYGGSLFAQDEKQAAVPPRHALEQRFHGPRGSRPDGRAGHHAANDQLPMEVLPGGSGRYTRHQNRGQIQRSLHGVRRRRH